MTRLPDPALLEAAAQFSSPKSELSAERMPEARKAARAARASLTGRHTDAVDVTDEGNRRRIVPKAGTDPALVIVYLHGGGWVNCDTVTHGGIMTDLAALTGHMVVGPEYPLAPENPYPSALDATCDAVRQVLAESPGSRIVLAGDSAGANLALATALRLRDEGQGEPLAALLLWYGCYRRCFDTPSHVAYGDGTYGLTSADMRTYWNWYLGDHPDPVYGDLTGAQMEGLPPCYLGEAELDCLADDTRWLAKRLTQAGIAHAYDFAPLVNHGYIHFGQVYDPSFEALRAAAHFLKSPAVTGAA